MPRYMSYAYVVLTPQQFSCTYTDTSSTFKTVPSKNTDVIEFLLSLDKGRKMIKV
jgi:hypothetical protein